MEAGMEKFVIFVGSAHLALTTASIIRRWVSSSLMMKQHMSLTDLPTEILQEIINHCDHELLENLALTSIRMRAIVAPKLFSTISVPTRALRNRRVRNSLLRILNQANPHTLVLHISSSSCSAKLARGLTTSVLSERCTKWAGNMIGDDNISLTLMSSHPQRLICTRIQFIGICLPNEDASLKANIKVLEQLLMVDKVLRTCPTIVNILLKPDFPELRP